MKAQNYQFAVKETNQGFTYIILTPDGKKIVSPVAYYSRENARSCAQMKIMELKSPAIVHSNF